MVFWVDVGRFEAVQGECIQPEDCSIFAFRDQHVLYIFVYIELNVSLCERQFTPQVTFSEAVFRQNRKSGKAFRLHRHLRIAEIAPSYFGCARDSLSKVIIIQLWFINCHHHDHSIVIIIHQSSSSDCCHRHSDGSHCHDSAVINSHCHDSVVILTVMIRCDSHFHHQLWFALSWFIVMINCNIEVMIHCDGWLSPSAAMRALSNVRQCLSIKFGRSLLSAVGVPSRILSMSAVWDGCLPVGASSSWRSTPYGAPGAKGQSKTGDFKCH